MKVLQSSLKSLLVDNNVDCNIQLLIKLLDNWPNNANMKDYNRANGENDLFWTSAFYFIYGTYVYFVSFSFLANKYWSSKTTGRVNNTLQNMLKCKNRRDFQNCRQAIWVNKQKRNFELTKTKQFWMVKESNGYFYFLSILCTHTVFLFYHFYQV